MENSTLSRNSVAFGLALAVTCAINSVIVVVKEKSDAVMNGMKQVTGHHWITHSLVVVLLFLVLGWLFGRANGGTGPKVSAGGLIRTVVSGVVLAGLIIVGFYLIFD